MKRVKVLTLASGDSLSIPVYTILGKKKGAPSVYLQSAMHGSEVQGSLVLALLLAHLEKNPPLGNVRIIPNCNPVGLNQKRGEYTDGRNDPVRGDNWNRKYFLPSEGLDFDRFLARHKKSTEKDLHTAYRRQLKAKLLAIEPKGVGERLALTLQRLSIDYDICLDLHCANRSVRHAYVPEFAVGDAAYLGIPFQLVMPTDKFGGSMDEVFFAPWAALLRHRGQGSIPAQGYTLELGNHEELSLTAAQTDLAGILNFLRHRGVIAGRARRFRPLQRGLRNYRLISAPQGGLMELVCTLGKPVKKGEVVIRLLNFGSLPRFTEIRSPWAGVPILAHSSAVVNEGAELLKILENT
jgi:uncharacterized protein